MPYRYTTYASNVDAEACAQALGVTFVKIGIEPAVAAFADMLAPAFADRAADATRRTSRLAPAASP